MIDFAQEILGMTPWSKQKEIFHAIQTHNRVSVASCHGIGKTYTAAAVGITFLYTHPDSIVITTAPTWRQVKELLWREIRGHYVRSNLWGKALTTQIELGPQWYAMGLATDEPDKFQGFHAASGHLLLICDEAAGVPQRIFEVAEGILTSRDSKVLLIGNPTSNDGLFYDTHHKSRESWYPIQISAMDSPNFTEESEVIPEFILKRLVTPDWVAARKVQWGEDSPIYCARVLGKFSDQTEDSLFSIAWLSLAKERVVRRDDRKRIEVGVDVARHGNSESVAYARQGGKVLGMDTWSNADTTASVTRAMLFGKKIKVSVYRVDATGVGGGVADGLRAKGCVVEEFISGSKAKDPKRFQMRRDESYWELREMMREGDIGGLVDSETRDQLKGIRYRYDDRGKIKIESKEDMRLRGVKSPDRADALMLAFAPSLKRKLIIC